jgi:hypothetical protein
MLFGSATPLGGFVAGPPGYIQGKTPQKAADQAAVSASNARSAADRLKRR